MKGLANIPIIIALALLLGITPFAIKQVQQNHNPQNRAAFTDTAAVPCTDLLSARNQYCTGNGATAAPNVPCTEISSQLAQHCSSITGPTPTIPRPTIYPPLTPSPTVRPPLKPTVIPTTSAVCTTGQTRCVGRIIFTCRSNRWYYSQVCRTNCLNGKCVNSVPNPLPSATKLIR